MPDSEIKLIADFKDGRPVFEVVPAVLLGEKRYRITASPGFAPGVAAGDEIELAPEERLGFRVLSRGGNVCVQLFLSQGDNGTRERIAELVQTIGGWIDGGLDGAAATLIILTFPVSAGFDRIETLMTTIAGLCDIDQWMYGNIYDVADGTTPLNWWNGE